MHSSNRTIPAASSIWTHQFGTAGFDQAFGVVVDGAGYAYVGGQTDGSLSGEANQGGFDAFVRKVDASGIAVWTRQFGTSALDQTIGIANCKLQIANFYSWLAGAGSVRLQPDCLKMNRWR
jgi:hypothetical protein